MTILVPTDFSPSAAQSLTYAINMAHLLKGQILLVHVIHLSPLTLGEVPPAVLDASIEERQNDAEALMQDALQRVHEAGLQGDSTVVEGLPFQAIVDIASIKHVDLIVMSTHGRTGLSHMFMGSVAEKVVRMAPCAVLVTRRSPALSET